MEGREAEEALGSAPAASTSAAVAVAAEEDAADVCGICQDSVQDWGKLSSCIHRFCFECIMEWAGVESTCPLCRARFSTVTRTRLLPSGQEEVVAVKKVQWRTQIHRPDSDEDDAAIQEAVGELLDDAADFCVICNDNGDDECLLLCDGCDVACHTYCCGLDSVPEGSWYCGVCRESMTNAVTRPSRSRNAQSNSSARTRSIGAASSAGGAETARTSSIIQSARRAARASARDAARGRRSATSRSNGRSSTVAPSPQPAAAPVLARGSTTHELQADAALMRSNWGLFQSRGFSPSVPSLDSGARRPGPSSEAVGQPAASTSSREDPAAAAEQSWQMAEQALRSIQMQQQTGREGQQQQQQQRGTAALQNRRQASSRERSAALDQVRSFILQRRRITGNRRGSTSSAGERGGAGARGGGGAVQQHMRRGGSETTQASQQQRRPKSPPRSPTGPPSSIMAAPCPSSGVPLGGLGRLAASPMRREPVRISVSGLQLAGARAASQRPLAPSATASPANGGARHLRQQQSSTAAACGAPTRPESSGPAPVASSSVLRASSTATAGSYTAAHPISAEISNPGLLAGPNGSLEVPSAKRAMPTETESPATAPEGGGRRRGGHSRRRREETDEALPPQAEAGGSDCMRPHKRRRHSDAADTSPAAAAAEGRPISRNRATAASSSKEAAFEAVKVELNPLYRSRELSRDDYKAVAQAATRILVAESRPRCSGAADDGGGAAADEAWLKPEAVRAAVQRAREGVLCPDGG